MAFILFWPHLFSSTTSLSIPCWTMALPLILFHDRIPIFIAPLQLTTRPTTTKSHPCLSLAPLYDDVNYTLPQEEQSHQKKQNLFTRHSTTWRGDGCSISITTSAPSTANNTLTRLPDISLSVCPFALTPTAYHTPNISSLIVPPCFYIHSLLFVTILTFTLHHCLLTVLRTMKTRFFSMLPPIPWLYYILLQQNRPLNSSYFLHIQKSATYTSRLDNFSSLHSITAFLYPFPLSCCHLLSYCFLPSAQLSLPSLPFSWLSLVSIFVIFFSFCLPPSNPLFFSLRFCSVAVIQLIFLLILPQVDKELQTHNLTHPTLASQ